MIIEVFKTNIATIASANEVEQTLLSIFPELKINFDLQDCDKILRIEAVDMDVTDILNAIKMMNIYCEPLL